jgi:hypothetical protein
MIGKKAMYGLFGAGIGTMTVAWFLLPKDSKIKKAISDKVCSLTDILKNQAGSMLGDATQKAKPSTVRTDH